MTENEKGYYKRRLQEMLGYPSVQMMREYFEAKAGDLEYFNERNFLSFVKSVMSLVNFMGYADPDEALRNLDEDVLNRYVKGLREKGNATATQRVKVAHVKRWTRVNGVKLEWDKVVLPKVRPVVNDRAPTKTELRIIMNYAPIWIIPTTLILTSSGMRVGSFIKLRLKHLNLDSFPDIAILEIPPEAAKGGIGYFTCITPEAREALDKHLLQRVQNGEILGPESSLIKAPKAKGNTTYASVAQAWNRCLKRAGLDEKSRGVHMLHLHTLRKFFRSQVEGTLTKSIREAMMGHVSGEYLDRNYLRIPEQEMVEWYRKAVPSLTVLEDVESEEYHRKQFLLTAEMLFPDKVEEIRNILARYKVFAEASDEIQELLNPKNREAKTVSSEEEMVELVSQDWDLVKELNGGKYLLKRG